MPRESAARRRERAREILRRLELDYPGATTALRWSTPWELLVATILSAQCTDERVNEVTSKLFKRYRRPEDYARADRAAFEREIHSTGFFRSKAKSVMGAAQALVERFGGEIPRTMEELTQLPGVARKTANVVLGTAFGIPSGVVVDTHVHRVSDRLALYDPAAKRSAGKVERALMDLLPQEAWIRFGHALIWHGRRVCGARHPLCDACLLRDVCPRRGVKAARPGARKKVAGKLKGKGHAEAGRKAKGKRKAKGTKRAARP